VSEFKLLLSHHPNSVTPEDRDFGIDQPRAIGVSPAARPGEGGAAVAGLQAGSALGAEALSPPG